MIDPLATWKSTLAALPKVADTSWALTFANWVAARVVSITTDPASLTLASPLLFTFNTASFASGLISLAPTNNPLAGITGFADAWANSIATITYPASLLVAPGAFIPPTSPTTLFSAITAVSIDPASILSGKAKIIELAAAVPVADPNDSLFPEKFRDAFLELTITVVGLDSTVPTPVPLTAANIPLI
jgi:hypothetical protein